MLDALNSHWSQEDNGPKPNNKEWQDVGMNIVGADFRAEGDGGVASDDIIYYLHDIITSKYVPLL